MAQHGMDWDAMGRRLAPGISATRARCLCGEHSAVRFLVDSPAMWRWLSIHLLDVIETLEANDAG